MSPRALALLTLLIAIPSGPALAADPTAKEQLMVYEINRSRSDPHAYAVEMGYPTDVIDALESVSAVPPLAINPLLIDSTRAHAVDMSTTGSCAHFSANLGWPNTVARDAGYMLPDRLPSPSGGSYLLPDDNNMIESIACGFGPGENDFSQPLNALNALLIDEGVVPPGHRIQLLSLNEFNSLWREVGAGFASSGMGFRNFWAIHTGTIDVDQSFLTGVVFADGNGNELYDEGEGIGGVTVSANAENTTTNAEGGWSLPVSDGSYTVTCMGGGFSDTASAAVSVAGLNRAVDCISGNPVAFVDFAVPEPGRVTLAIAAFATLGALARARRSSSSCSAT
ncbi:MAG: hypothetical protein QNK03_27935 [Myxococcota bacterium]|nr:hypothetical protein [Myxococcota bacterium]